MPSRLRYHLTLTVFYLYPPNRFAALAQWYEMTWGNVVDSRSDLLAHCAAAGLRVTEETAFSRFSILVAAKD